MKQRHLIRNLQAGDLLELFLVSAVAAVLAIRFYLHLAGYPRIGGGGLHVAHVLWGGLLMMAAIVVLLSFLGRRAAAIAAVLGGVGFGTFLDEVGKFVTDDNDYFFQPSVGIMYITFVLVYLAARAVHRRSRYTPEEYLVNAIKELDEAARRDLDRREKERALRFLGRSDPRHPLVPALVRLIEETPLVPDPAPDPFTRLTYRAGELYRRVVSLPGFEVVLIAFFLLQLLVRVGYVAALVFFPDFQPGAPLGRFRDLDRESLRFVDLAEIGSTLLSAAFVMAGVWRMRRSRLAAYRSFHASVLVTIFLTQVFAFFDEQFSALVGLGLNLLLLLALDYVIREEEEEELHG